MTSSIGLKKQLMY